MSSKIIAMKMVMAEVERATKKFPEWPSDPLHAAAVIAEELGELTQRINECIYEPHKVNATRGNVQEEAIQVGAMAIRFIMSLPNYQYVRAPQHEQ